MNEILVDQVLQRANMRDVVLAYLPGTTPQHNRIPCPFHNGKNNNLSFNNRTFNCFVCGASGNAIHFTRKMFDLPFVDTVKKLNNDFMLGVDLDDTTKESTKDLERIRYERERERGLRKERYNASYERTLDIMERLEVLKAQDDMLKQTTITDDVAEWLADNQAERDRLYYELDCLDAEQEQMKGNL